MESNMKTTTAFRALNARRIAMDEMRREANKLGANAIVGIDVDYEVLGADNGMLMVCVSGTAVKI